MEQVARAGASAGTGLMPILRGLCDDDATPENVVRRTATGGPRRAIHAGRRADTGPGRASSATKFSACCASASPTCCRCTSGSTRLAPMAVCAAVTRTPSAGASVIHAGSMASPAVGPARSSPATSGRTRGKRIVEALANECHWMELRGEPGQRVWAYRKAAWAIEELEVDFGLIYRQIGRKGLESVENVGPRPAAVIEHLLNELLVNPEGCGQPIVLGYGALPGMDSSA